MTDSCANKHSSFVCVSWSSKKINVRTRTTARCAGASALANGWYLYKLRYRYRLTLAGQLQYTYITHIDRSLTSHRCPNRTDPPCPQFLSLSPPRFRSRFRSHCRSHSHSHSAVRRP